MLSFNTRSFSFIGLTVFFAIQMQCQAGLIVSLDGLTLDNNNQALVRVLAEHDGNGGVPTIDSFSLRLRIEPVSGAAGGTLQFLDDGQSLDARNSDPDHLFAGKGTLLFDVDAFNNDQELKSSIRWGCLTRRPLFPAQNCSPHSPSPKTH